MSIKQQIIQWMPSRFELRLRYAYNQFLGRLEREIVIIDQLAGKKRRCLDIGANVGLYTYRFSQCFDKVEAFEPNLACARKIVAAKLAQVRVHNLALSNKSGTGSLCMPDTGSPADSALASLSNQFSDAKTLPVKLQTLDEFQFTEVDLIKIDVEGHEIEVLEGGRNTIIQNWPTLLIEIEQRHHVERDIREIFQLIENLGYQGSFYQQGSMVPLDQFSADRHQKNVDPMDRDHYVNNFIFRPLLHESET